MLGGVSGHSGVSGIGSFSIVVDFGARQSSNNDRFLRCLYMFTGRTAGRHIAFFLSQ